MKHIDLINIIEKIAPLYAAADWDVCGMQVAAQRQDIQHIAVCLDATPDSIGKALKQGADFILSHHPLLMHPRLPAKLDDYHAVLSLLFTHNVALYAAHTSLDVNPDGPAGWLARTLKLHNTQVLQTTASDATPPLGFGLVGTLSQALTLKELVQLLSTSISLAGAHLCGPVPAQIQKIAYCTGSGASLLPQVVQSGADIYVTGDIKYHTALESHTCILDVGHHSLEEEMMHQMCALLATQLPQITVSFVPSVSPLRPLVVHNC